MLKKLICLSLVVLFVFSLSACGKTKILHCDNCDAEVEVAENSNMTEEWELFCSACEKELGLDTIISDEDVPLN